MKLKLLRWRRNEKGSVFLTTLIAMFMMVLIGGAVYQLSSQQMHYISRLKKTTEASFLAEAGLSHAVATLTTDFDYKDDPSRFPATNLGDGTYDVTVIQSGGRVLLKSVGTVGDVQRTVSLEVEDTTPTALNYGEAAGGNILLAAVVFGDSDVTGNLFANQDVSLKAWLASSVTINGNVYAGGTVTEGTFAGGTVTYWSKTDNAGNVTFPNYDFNFYRAIAQANGRYYAASQTWTNTTFDLNASGGVLFVEGDITFRGTCNITGTVIATGTISIFGVVNQTKAASYPSYPSMMTAQNDILLLKLPFISTGKLFANGLVYAGRDFKMLGIGTQTNVNGSIIAKGVLQQGEIASNFDLIYSAQNPPGLITTGGATSPINVKSYNA